MDRAGRSPVWLLPIGPDHVGGRPPRQDTQSERRRHRRRHGEQHLPLRDVPADPRGDSPSRPDQEGRRVMPAAGTGRMALSRRTLLKGGITVGTGLVVGFRLLPAGRQAALAQSAAFAPNQWISIDRDGLVTIINSVVEMGQGSITTMPAIMADELDTDLGKVKVVQAPANPKFYANPVTGSQSYGGSRGVRDHIEMLRRAGAPAAEMLRDAAAREWGVPVSEADTELATVTHTPRGRRPPYSALVKRPPKLPAPQTPPLKTPDKYRYMGKVMHRRDTPLKV